MADRTQRRMVERDENPRDPFAELTRIMGFDPRVPVAKAPPAANAADPRPHTPEPEDFGIDLEKEMMGAFEEPAPIRGAHGQNLDEPANAAPSFAPAHGGLSHSGLFDQDDASATEHAAPSEEFLDLDALALDDGFEAAFAATLEQELALDEEWAAQDAGLNVPLDETGSVEEAELRGDFEPWEPVSQSGSSQALFDRHEPPAGEGRELPGYGSAVEGHEAGSPATESEPELSPATYTEQHPRASSDPDLELSIEQELGMLLGNPMHMPAPAASHAETAADWDAASLSAAFNPVDHASVGDAGLLAPESVGADYSGEGEFQASAFDATNGHYPAGAGEADDASGEVAYTPEADEHDFAQEPGASIGHAAVPFAGAGAVSFGRSSLSDDHQAHQPSEPAGSSLASEFDSWDAEEFTASLQGELRTLDATQHSETVFEEDPFHPLDEDGDSSTNDQQSRPTDELSLHQADQAQWHELGNGPALEGWPTEAAAEETAEHDQTEQPSFVQASFDPDQPYHPEQPDDQLEASSTVDLPEAGPEQATEPNDDPFAALAAMAAQYRAGRQAPNWRPGTAFTPALATSNAQPAPARDGGTMTIQQPLPYDDMPDIETVDVPEQPIALADDLDLPEVAYAEPPRSAASYDDLDAEFAGLLQEMSSAEPILSEPGGTRAMQPPLYDEPAGYDPSDPRDYSAAVYNPVEQATPDYAPGAAGNAHAPAADLNEAPDHGHATESEGHWAEAGYAADDDLALGDENGEVAGLAGDEPAELRRRPARRGMLAAAVVGGVALLGGLGALAMSLGDGDSSGAPVLVRADTGPLKVRPENPGGTQVPNQDNKVYETVTGDSAAAPAQEKLVTTAEEPLDLAASEPMLELGEPQDEVETAIGEEAALGEEAATDEAVMGEALVDATGEETVTPKGTVQAEDAVTAKGEDRLEQVIAASEQDAAPELIAVAPRKVRTMIVKPDGTLVPREVVAPEPVAVEPPPAGVDAAALEPTPADPAPAEPTATEPAAEELAALAPPDQALDEPAAVAEATGAVEPVAAPIAVAPTEAAPGQPAQSDPAAAEPASPARKRTTATTPASMKVAPGRPAQQPVDVVGEVKADQTAALAAPAGGSWSMQIASQPSEASARSTYADLVRRHGSVLAGRSASIVKAEVSGKGTYYRVRVPASSRNEAVELCSKYKASGGNCFVSR